MLPGSVSDDQGSPSTAEAPTLPQPDGKAAHRLPPAPHRLLTVFTGLQNRQLSPTPSHLIAGQDPRLALSTLP